MSYDPPPLWLVTRPSGLAQTAREVSAAQAVLTVASRIGKEGYYEALEKSRIYGRQGFFVTHFAGRWAAEKYPKEVIRC